MGQNHNNTALLPYIISRQSHQFHILGSSPLPVLTGLTLFVFLIALLPNLHGCTFSLLGASMHVGFVGLFWVVIRWFNDILAEAIFGFHSKKVQLGLRLGILLFIASEVIFFFAFFWSFFHVSLVPSVSIGAVWPPTDTQPLDFLGLPLVNTLLLLSSGVTITIAHAYVVKDNIDAFSWYLLLTIILGITFLFCQAYEYKHGVKFSWRDNIYGSIFFITTGFHGLHVTIGTIFLLYCWLRQNLPQEVIQFILPSWVTERHDFSSPLPCRFTATRHFGFEAAAWYWHFVDVVWLFLFLTIYWWGGV